MTYYQDSPYIRWHDELPETWRMYVCRIREGRSKARVAAVFEMLSLLARYNPAALLSGPAGDQKGVYWIGVAQKHELSVEALFRYAGYTSHVFKVCPVAEDDSQPVKWRGAVRYLKPVYIENATELRERAPDRRLFMMRKPDGQAAAVRGYRGDGTALGRRGLAAEDARLLVNLAVPAGDTPVTFLDAFAGIGGLIIEAVERGMTVFSGDIDPVVAAGNRHFGARHSVMNAAHLPFCSQAFGGIAAELPFHEDARPVTQAFMEEAWRILKPGGRVALMGVEWQAAVLEESARRCGFVLLLVSEILRKGTTVWVGVWQKPAG